MRLMYDAITPSNIPKTATMVASYVNGKWPNFNEAVKLFPHAKHVSITVNNMGTADVLDIERYDATPQQAPAWVQRMRSLNRIPTVYMSQAAWPSVKDAFQSQNVAPPNYWVANYNPSYPLDIPDGAIGLQYKTTQLYDVSIVADYWPGIDPPQVEENDMTPQEMINVLNSTAGQAAIKNAVENSVIRHLMDWSHKRNGSIESFLSGIPGYVPLESRTKK